MSFQITVPAGPAAPATVRHALMLWLGARATNGLLTDAPLVVSELVTNSMRHAETAGEATIHVWAQLAHDVLRIEVEDTGTGGNVVRRTANRVTGGGFGLNIVDALAQAWGVRREGGTLVWVEMGAPAG
jgi:anti-sigma regulatory factor (Ser/Thr protein kinase)